MPSESDAQTDSILAELQANFEVHIHKGAEHWALTNVISFLNAAWTGERCRGAEIDGPRLRYWERNGCPWINGEKLRLFTKTRKSVFCDAKQAKQIALQIRNRHVAPDYPGLIVLDDLADDLKRSRTDVLELLFKKWRKGIGEPNKLPELKWGRNAKNYPHIRAYVPAQFAEWAKRRIAGKPLDAAEVSLADFAKIQGKRRGSIRQSLKAKGVEILARRAIAGDGTARDIQAVPRKLLDDEPTKLMPNAEALKTKHNGKDDELIPRALALTLYPHIKPYVYVMYAGKTCPLIGGEKLHAPHTAWPNGYRITNSDKPRGFLKSQLEKFPRVRIHNNRQIASAAAIVERPREPASPAITWISIGQAALTSAINHGVISRAVDDGEIKSNGEKGKGKRKIDAADFMRWQLERAKKR